ncbi:hypothetical protein HK096_007129, partial [Nowakowskiella sp. JEL0078]
MDTNKILSNGFFDCGAVTFAPNTPFRPQPTNFLQDAIKDQYDNLQNLNTYIDITGQTNQNALIQQNHIVNMKKAENPQLYFNPMLIQMQSPSKQHRDFCESPGSNFYQISSTLSDQSLEFLITAPQEIIPTLTDTTLETRLTSDTVSGNNVFIDYPFRRPFITSPSQLNQISNFERESFCYSNMRNDHLPHEHLSNFYPTNYSHGKSLSPKLYVKPFCSPLEGSESTSTKATYTQTGPQTASGTPNTHREKRDKNITIDNPGFNSGIMKPRHRRYGSGSSILLTERSLTCEDQEKFNSLTPPGSPANRHLRRIESNPIIKFSHDGVSQTLLAGQASPSIDSASSL